MIKKGDRVLVRPTGTGTDGSKYLVVAVADTSVDMAVEGTVVAADHGDVVVDIGGTYVVVPDKLVEKKKPKEDPRMTQRGNAERYSYYAVRKGYRRPAVYIFQMAASRLGKAEWNLGVDGVAGDEFDRVAREIQEANGYGADGEIGKSWAALTSQLGGWRPPLRLRIAELECTYESGRRGFGYGGSKSIIPYEGWPNYGVWNVNWQAKWQSFGGSSLGAMLRMGGAMHLKRYEPGQSEVIADWFGSIMGRETQMGPYMDANIIGPAVKHLKRAGFDFPLSEDNLSEQLPLFDDGDEVALEPWQERLLALACDICVNSGSHGFFSKKTPRQWDGDGPMKWPDWLPDKEAVKAIYAEEFGGTIKNDSHYLVADSREPSAKAMKRCLWELCESDDQRIALIADMQGRVVITRWRSMVTARRRSIAIPDYNENFQGSDYEPGHHFGIGM